VAFAYGRHTVFDGLSWSAGTGITGLLGENGAGKTTLLRLLATVTTPSAGSIRVLGVDPDTDRHRRTVRENIGYLPQQARWAPSLTVDDFVTYFAWMRRVPRSKRARAVDQALEWTDLHLLRHRRLGQLSGGEYQRVMLSQALVHSPRLLILDEPTAGLDPAQRSSFRGVLTRLASTCTIVISTHLLEDVAEVADALAVLSAGGITFQGSPADLKKLGSATSDSSTDMERGFLRAIGGETWNA
jgi:ABC-2 type transport system ATP-binding protein